MMGPARVGRAVALVAALALVGCGSSHPRAENRITAGPSSPASSASIASPSGASSSRASSSRAASRSSAKSKASSAGHSSSAAGTSSAPLPTSPSHVAPAPSSVPRFDHVVVVVEENRSYADVIGNSAAPYLNSLASAGALFTRSFALTHPSEPNYLALFSGAMHGLTDDSCPHSYPAANLGSQLIGAGLSFAGYSETMPSDGFTGCSSGQYARKHAPWVNFPNVPASDNRMLSRFSSNYAALPTVSFVIPNLDDDMHDGSVAGGDRWLKAHLDGYARWASTHNSLLIVTWDEDDRSAGNQIATIFYGQSVRPGRYSERITHYRVLRTLQAAYGLPALGGSGAAPITDVWR
jgi:acid phosphatase